jgi:hypothetical protein
MIVRLWYSSIVELTKAACPRLFLRTNRGIRTHRPLSYLLHPKKLDIPVLAPNVNHYAHPLHHSQATEIHAMLFTLHSDFAEGTTPITSDDMLVILDSGCTCAITFDKSDFIGPIHPVQDVELMGISSGLKVAGVGQVIWTFLDENLHRVQIPLTCLYIPEDNTCLLPPQQLSEWNEASTANGSWIGYGGSAHVFHEGSCIKFPYHKDPICRSLSLHQALPSSRHSLIPLSSLPAMICCAQTIYHQHPESSYGFTIDWDTKVFMRFNNGQLMDCTAYWLMLQIVQYRFVELASLVQQRNDRTRRTTLAP